MTQYRSLGLSVVLLVAPLTVSAQPRSALTSDQVAASAARVSFDAAAKREAVREAAARADEALIALFPRLSGGARYTRLSDVSQPRLFEFDGSIVGTSARAGSVDPSTVALPVPAFSNVLDNYSLRASLSVPLSDYPLRLFALRAAARDGERAASAALRGARAKAAAEGRIAYFNWLRARAAVDVAVQALANRQAHSDDTKAQSVVGNVPGADSLRAETAVAAAQLALARAQELVAVSEAELRVAVRAQPGLALVPAETLDAPVQAIPVSLDALRAAALSDNPELLALSARASSARRSARAAGAARWPVLSAFADVEYANPNPRRFPPRDAWYSTWAVGVQLSASPNEIASGFAAEAQLSARARGAEAERNSLREAVALEVERAYRASLTADTAIVSSELELHSANESKRVVEALFASGRIAASELADAETELNRARFDLLNAKADARIGRVRLAYALGHEDGALH